MPIIVTRVTTDSKGIAKFLHGRELGDALQEAALDIIRLCRPQSKRLAAGWYHKRGPNLIIGAFSRRTEIVQNDHRAAAAIEFGSGPGAEGASGPKPRRQGGSSAPKRILGKAGAQIGDYKGDLG